VRLDTGHAHGEGGGGGRCRRRDEGVRRGRVAEGGGHR
jgi:hypothetical protein